MKKSIVFLVLCSILLFVFPFCREGFDRRYIQDDVLARKAVAYSGYRAGQNPENKVYPSEEQIRQDLNLLIRGGWGFIRIFDCGPHAERVLNVIMKNNLDLKVLLGIWIAGGKADHDKENLTEIEKGIQFANTYNDIVVAVSVGNETLDAWSSVRTPVKDLTAYIKIVRNKVKQPVTTDDQGLPFTLGNDGDTSYADVIEVMKSVDFLAVHAYAFLDAPWSWGGGL